MFLNYPYALVLLKFLVFIRVEHPIERADQVLKFYFRVNIGVRVSPPAVLQELLVDRGQRPVGLLVGLAQLHVHTFLHELLLTLQNVRDPLPQGRVFQLRGDTPST
jgi:hypothetical protein